MDEIVKQAMHKWPNVPNCFGWLGLDMRGNWYMRDDTAQAVGAFNSNMPGAKGSLVQHRKLIEFIGRNYASDHLGQWYFQNGPQKVYVELQATPWIWRIDSQCNVTNHLDIPSSCIEALTDEHGWLYLLTTTGFGLVHTQDVGNAAQAIEQGKWHLSNVIASALPERYGYIQSPAATSAHNARTKP